MLGKFVDCAKDEDISLVRSNEVGETVVIVEGELISLLIMVLSLGLLLTKVDGCSVVAV